MTDTRAERFRPSSTHTRHHHRSPFWQRRILGRMSLPSPSVLTICTLHQGRCRQDSSLGVYRPHSVRRKQLPRLSVGRGCAQAHQRLPSLTSAISSTSPNMSSMSTPPTTALFSIFEAALNQYQKKTKRDLRAHPLFSQLQACDSPADILTILQDQVDQSTQSRTTNERLKRWLGPTISVLYAFSETLGAGVSLVNVDLSVGDIPLTYSIGFLSRKCYFCWCWCPPLGTCPRLFTRADSCDIRGS